MNKIVNNKYLNAFFYLMLFSACVHIAILLFLTIIKQDIYILNYFNILDVDIFYPNIFNNLWGNIFSVLVMVGIYGIILKLCQEKKL